MCCQLFLQREGGPKGLRFTASLANLVGLLGLTKKEGIEVKLYLRYVDDCRTFLRAIKKGWIWSGSRICFSEREFNRDEDTEKDKVERMTRLITGMVCSITDNLRFTGEDSTQFQDATLPTLDTTLCVE